jgi:hypothetical protein
MTSLSIQTIQYICLNTLPDTYPDLKPTISYLSSYTAEYVITNSMPFTVYVRGTNFTRNGRTTITFGSYQNLPITFFSSTSISFTIPMQATPGQYNVQIINDTPIGKVSSNTDIFTIES